MVALTQFFSTTRRVFTSQDGTIGDGGGDGGIGAGMSGQEEVDGHRDMANEPFNLRVDRDWFVPLASVAIAVGSLFGVSRIKGHSH